MSSAIAWLARDAFALRRQIDREIAHLRLRAQIIVAHEAVEVERRRRPGIGLDRGQLRQVLQPVGRRLQHAVRLLERRALRQIDDDLDLRLVVERQQLHRDVLGDEQRADGDAWRAPTEIRKIFERDRPFSSGVAMRM